MSSMQFTQTIDIKDINNAVSLNTISCRIKSIANNLDSLSGITFEHHPPYMCKFPDGVNQYRVNCRVIKQGRKTTWDMVYEQINKIHAVYYNHKKTRLEV